VGAELEEDKELGKETDVRAPIHTHARLDIFLVLFYNEANLVRGRDDIDTNGRKGNSNQPECHLMYLSLSKNNVNDCHPLSHVA